MDIFGLPYKTNDFDRIIAKMIAKAANTCFPVKVRAYHVFSPKNSVLELILPFLKFLVPRHTRRRMHVHSSSRTLGYFEGLTQFGLYADGMPTSLGGTFEFNTNWVDEQLELDQDHDR